MCVPHILSFTIIVGNKVRQTYFDQWRQYNRQNQGQTMTGIWLPREGLVLVVGIDLYFFYSFIYNLMEYML